MLRKGAGPSFIRDRLTKLRQGRSQSRNPIRNGRKEVCYDMLGCFPTPRKHSPLKKAPESPEAVDTKFFLHTRTNTSAAELILYGDDMHSLKISNFKIGHPVKVIVHGYKSNGIDAGALAGAKSFLNLMDVNVILVDWEKGAAGPSYPTAVANTELVGRQISLMLFDMLSLGTKPLDIHLIGFSLGAHVAACASHVLQSKGIKLGRITGLDPASPIYKNQMILESSRKLDKNDAHFVDVIHTDGSPDVLNGFGLLQPIGHVDFFPNGGKEQPGCNDGRASLFLSHLEGTVNSSLVCSHVRAWRLFLESLEQPKGGCRFTAYPCQTGPLRFQKNICLPPTHFCDVKGYCGQMGIGAEEEPGRGALYLVTRDTWPYCGQQLRASVLISGKTQQTRGVLHMHLKHGSSFTNFRMYYDTPDVIEGGRALWGLAAAQYGSLHPKRTPSISAVLSYQSLRFQTTEQDDGNITNPEVYVDKVTITDLDGNRWYYCKKETLLEETNQTNFEELLISLTLFSCQI